jgi:hypothetical protein
MNNNNNNNINTKLVGRSRNTSVWYHGGFRLKSRLDGYYLDIGNIDTAHRWGSDANKLKYLNKGDNLRVADAISCVLKAVKGARHTGEQHLVTDGQATFHGLQTSSALSSLEMEVICKVAGRIGHSACSCIKESCQALHIMNILSLPQLRNQIYILIFQDLRRLFSYVIQIPIILGNNIN